ncbi:MAG: hypothetical protein V3V84_07615 [Candidatus Bathyarchaeia archaeon]
MATNARIAVTASGLEFPNPIVRKNNVVTYGGPVTGTVTAGTLTINCKAPRGLVFESPKDSEGNVLNTINLASPQKLNIPGKIESYEFTISGFAGTATEIFLPIDSFD